MEGEGRVRALREGWSVVQGDAGTDGGKDPARGHRSGCDMTEPVMVRRWASEQLDAPHRTASPSSFGERLTLARWLLGLSRDAFAKQLGVDPSTVWRWPSSSKSE